ncbi:LLM class flavin-dependent oxidoreductase [Dongia soli]|uniref:LLM class flavin-dependent oxidoreductase n=1 Tax=Dongia soli TaxID=600628 RepID=A0ABU5EAX1_9PROT|nr:LLM class flavin-dependent oxidoreductase [Dongia soli]MDY0882678.1 LLM class flavin-dependent oxidoreductase [Dongia soli]
MSRLAETPLSVLDLAPLIHGGSAADAFKRSLDLARHVERLGYTRFWLAEHHNIAGVASSATSVLIGHIAGGTSTIRVGSGGVMLPNHAPLVIAEAFGTLEALYPGRIDLGLGRAPGADQRTMRALRVDPRAGDAFPDLVQELRYLLGPIEPGQTIQAVPGAGSQVPIWLLGSSDFSARLAGLLGLPYAFAGQFAPAGMLEALAIYRAHFRPSEVLEKPYAMVGIPVVAADTDAEAARQATTAQQKFLNLIRGNPIPLMPPVEDMNALWTPREQIGVDRFLGAAIVGGPTAVKEKLEALLETTQADEVMINSDFYRHEDRLRSYEIVADIWKS